MNKNNTRQHEKYYSIRELSNLTGINPSLIRYWKHRKQISYIQDAPGSVVLIPYAEFLEFLERNTNRVEDENGQQAYK
jgi:excisionase family DNA binding protein